MDNPQNNSTSTNAAQSNQLPSCKVCGRQDETLRLSRFPYVISAVVRTYRRGYAGYWCKRHRNRYWTRATIITALLGWLGFPFGLIYTPIVLFGLAKGGDQFPEKNALLLRLLADQKLQKGDAEGARRCLEASLQCQDNQQASDQLRRLYAGSLSYAQTTPLNKLSSVIFPVLVLSACTILSGVIIGLLNYHITEAIFSLFGDFLSYIELVIGLIPTVAIGIMLIMGVWQLMNWAFEHMQITQRPLAVGIATLTALLTNYSFLVGRATGLLLEAIQYHEPISDPYQMLVIGGALITRGGAFIISDAVRLGGTSWLIFLIIIAFLLAYSIIMMATTASQSAAYYDLLERLKPSITVTAGQNNNPAWMALSLVLASIIVVIMAFPQNTTVDYLVASQHTETALGFMKDNKIPEAIQELQTAIQVYPNSIDAHLDLGWLYMHTNQSDLAEAEFNKVIGLTYSNASAHSGLGEVYYVQYDLDKADYEFQQTLKINPNDDFTYAVEGWVDIDKGNQAEAEKNFQKALALNPQSANAYVGMGNIYAQQGNSAQSLILIKKLLKLTLNQPMLTRPWARLILTLIKSTWQLPN